MGVAARRYGICLTLKTLDLESVCNKTLQDQLCFFSDPDLRSMRGGGFDRTGPGHLWNVVRQGSVILPPQFCLETPALHPVIAIAVIPHVTFL